MLGIGERMMIIGLRSELVEPGDSLIDVFSRALSSNRVPLRDGDVVAVTSKIVGISEKRIRKIDSIRVSRDARSLARKFSLSPSFAQVVLDESDAVVGGVEGAILTIKNDDAIANAGIDRKNAPEGTVVLWPSNPDSAARNLRTRIRKKFGKDVFVVIVDSRVTPLRLGTTGFAIGVAGFHPVEDIRGSADLSGRRVEITFRAIADGIAAAAQVVMGEESERRPFAIVRGAPLQPGKNASIREAKLSRNKCLYMSQIAPVVRKSPGKSRKQLPA